MSDAFWAKLNAAVPVDLEEAYRQQSVELHKTLVKIREAQFCALKQQPKCPECGSIVLREKCVYDYGSDCPRHEVIERLGGRERLNEHFWTLEGASKKCSAKTAVEMHATLKEGYRNRPKEPFVHIAHWWKNAAKELFRKIQREKRK